MTDEECQKLCAELRNAENGFAGDIFYRAADEIERLAGIIAERRLLNFIEHLQAENSKLRKALVRKRQSRYPDWPDGYGPLA